MERNIETSESNDFFIPESIKQNAPEKVIEAPIEKVEENVVEPVLENIEEINDPKSTYKIDASGKKISTMVPKERFDEKNNLAKDLEAKLKESERIRIQMVERSKQALDLSKFDLNNYEKPELWAQDIMLEIDRQTEEKITDRLEQQKIIEKVKTAEENLIKGFDQNIEETSKEIPDIANVVTEFAKYKEYLPRETIYTIMGDENSAKVIHEIMTTENMLRNLSEMSPVQAARIIGKLSAKMDLQKEYSENNTQSRSEQIREIPSTPIPSRPKVAGSPNLKGASDISTIRVDENDESIASYRASKPKKTRR